MVVNHESYFFNGWKSGDRHAVSDMGTDTLFGCPGFDPGPGQAPAGQGEAGSELVALLQGQIWGQAHCLGAVTLCVQAQSAGAFSGSSGSDAPSRGQTMNSQPLPGSI